MASSQETLCPGMGLCEAAPNSAGGPGELITPKKGYHEMPCGNIDLREHSQCCTSVAAKQDHQGCCGSSLLSWLFKMRANEPTQELLGAPCIRAADSRNPAGHGHHAGRVKRGQEPQGVTNSSNCLPGKQGKTTCVIHVVSLPSCSQAVFTPRFG